MNINIKLLNEFAKVPTHGSADALVYVLYAGTYSEVEIQPHDTVKVEIGIAIEIPKG